MLNKIKCFFGLHQWETKIKYGDILGFTSFDFVTICRNCGKDKQNE